jgi:hypothetical protein
MSPRWQPSFAVVGRERRVAAGLRVPADANANGRAQRRVFSRKLLLTPATPVKTVWPGNAVPFVLIVTPMS